MSPRFKTEWYQDARGDAPVHRWLTEELSEGARELAGAAILEILQADGPGVCGTRFAANSATASSSFAWTATPNLGSTPPAEVAGRSRRANYFKARESSTASSVTPTATG